MYIFRHLAVNIVLVPTTMYSARRRGMLAFPENDTLLHVQFMTLGARGNFNLCLLIGLTKLRLGVWPIPLYASAWKILPTSYLPVADILSKYESS